MKTADLIGHKIKDIIVWSKTQVGGLDEAEVFIQLDNGKTVCIPFDFDSESIERSIKEDAKSLFVNLGDFPVYHINQEGKTITEIQNAKKNVKSSLVGKIKGFLRIKEDIPNEYKIYKTDYEENKLKYLQNQKIVDFIMFENYNSVGFIELENGYLITETLMAPHGTGHAGLNYYESLQRFEASCGRNYKRLKK
jgi:hypothetical protein